MNLSDIQNHIALYSRKKEYNILRILSKDWYHSLATYDRQIIKNLREKYQEETIYASLIDAVKGNDIQMVKQVLKDYRGYLPLLRKQLEQYASTEEMYHLVCTKPKPETILLRYGSVSDIIEYTKGKDLCIIPLCRYGRIDVIKHMIDLKILTPRHYIHLTRNIIQQLDTSDWPRDTIHQCIALDIQGPINPGGKVPPLRIFTSDAYQTYLVNKERIDKSHMKDRSLFIFFTGSIRNDILHTPTFVKSILEMFIGGDIPWKTDLIDAIDKVLSEVIGTSIFDDLLAISYIGGFPSILDKYLTQESKKRILPLVKGATISNNTERFLKWKCI